ncbi:MAG: M81 family peptidase [Betaproteobacteria bacterium]|nr:M81 family peptidase [Betaproteobacteria bacterium]
MARIAIGGMQHETNTFAPTKASYRAFEQGGGWPGVQRGDSMFEALAGANIPAQGAIEAFRAQGHRLIPLTWAAASPSAHVTQDAFERIVGSLEEDLRRSLTSTDGIDAVYLDLHGAMVTEDHEDGEGEILRRVRAIVGPRIPIVASLDLHANVTKAMVEYADAMSIYRTYPHVDMAETGARAAFLAMQMMASGKRPLKQHHAFSYLTGIPSQSTFIEPAKSLYALLAQLERIAYGHDAKQLDLAMKTMIDAVESAEKDFALELLTPKDAIQRAMRLGSPGRPVIIADTQDNPGAGGNGDTTGMLEALIELKAQDACLGLLIDPIAADRAHEAGQGASLEFELGARSGLPGHHPVRRRFTVERLGDGRFTCTGPMFKGFRMQLGKMALLRHEGVRVAIASIKCQAGDQEMFRHLGLEPAQQRLMVLKSSVHFRADFQPIATEVIVARSPGPALADPADFAWTKLRRGVRLNPLGRAF